MYKRQHGAEEVLVILNGSDQAKEVDLNHFRELYSVKNSGLDVVSKRSYDLSQERLSLAPRAALVLELQ